MQFVKLLIGEPCLPVVRLVDSPNALVENVFEDDRPKIRAKAHRRIGGESRSLIDHLPAEVTQLV